MAYANVLVGLHQPSSATTVARDMNSGQTAVRGGFFIVTGGKYTVADSATVLHAKLAKQGKVEFLLEEAGSNSAGKATGVIGVFEGETDQYSGTINDGDLLTIGTVATAGKLIADDQGTPVAPIAVAIGAPANGVLRFQSIV